MGLQNKIETELEVVGVEVSEFENFGLNVTSFLINTTDAAQVAGAAGLLNEVVRGQKVFIERFDGNDVTCFQIENPTITVSETTGWARDPDEQKFLEGENIFIELNIHELNRGTTALNNLASWIGMEENGIVYEGTC